MTIECPPERRATAIARRPWPATLRALALLAALAPACKVDSNALGGVGVCKVAADCPSPEFACVPMPGSNPPVSVCCKGCRADAGSGGSGGTGGSPMMPPPPGHDAAGGLGGSGGAPGAERPPTDGPPPGPDVPRVLSIPRMSRCPARPPLRPPTFPLPRPTARPPPPVAPRGAAAPRWSR